MAWFLAECIVPVRCINPADDYSTADPPQLAWYFALLIIVAGFALAAALIAVRRRI